MRRVDKNNIPKPAILDSEECINHLNSIVQNPNAVKANRIYYRGRVILPSGKYVDTVAVALKDLYNNKCAYCEKLCHYPRVEHFRPKGRVTGASPTVNGYYWLCYEWTNLLPACHECNSIEAKSDKFPISGVRRANHPTSGAPPAFDINQSEYTSHYLLSEGPLYIHPEYCVDFNIHFNFNYDGRMIGLTPHGINTVSDLKLDNEDLNGWRRKIYNDYLLELQKIVRKYKRPINPKTEEWFIEAIQDFVDDLVQSSLNHELEYTLFRKSLINKVDYFFIQPFEDVFQEELRNKISNALINT